MALQFPAFWPRARGAAGTPVAAGRASPAWFLLKLLIFAAVLLAAWSLFPAVAHAGPFGG